MPEPLMLGVIAALALIIVVTFWLIATVRRQRRQIQETTAKLEQLSSMISGLCSAAVGVDKRVIQLERKGRDLEHRQESMETQQDSDRPYGEAIQLVHQGATASRLVEELGLSRTEAELVVMLHGMEKTG